MPEESSESRELNNVCVSVRTHAQYLPVIKVFRLEAMSSSLVDHILRLEPELQPTDAEVKGNLMRRPQRASCISDLQGGKG